MACLLPPASVMVERTAKASQLAPPPAVMVRPTGIGCRCGRNLSSTVVPRSLIDQGTAFYASAVPQPIGLWGTRPPPLPPLLHRIGAILLSGLLPPLPIRCRSKGSAPALSRLGSRQSSDCSHRTGRPTPTKSRPGGSSALAGKGEGVLRITAWPRQLSRLTAFGDAGRGWRGNLFHPPGTKQGRRTSWKKSGGATAPAALAANIL